MKKFVCCWFVSFCFSVYACEVGNHVWEVRIYLFANCKSWNQRSVCKVSCKTIRIWCWTCLEATFIVFEFSRPRIPQTVSFGNFWECFANSTKSTLWKNNSTNWFVEIWSLWKIFVEFSKIFHTEFWFVEFRIPQTFSTKSLCGKCNSPLIWLKNRGH